MSDEIVVGPGSISGGLTWNMGTQYDPKGLKQSDAEKYSNFVRKKKTDVDLYGEGLLGIALGGARAGRLSELFGVPPFSVLSARDGYWQDRKRAWLSLGIQSELGRGLDGDQTASFKNQDKLNAFQANRKPAAPPLLTEAVPPWEPPAILPVPKATAKPKAATRPSAPRFSIPAITITQKPEVAHPVKRATVEVTRPEAPASTWRLPDPSSWPDLRAAKRLAVDVETCDPELMSKGPGVRRGAYIVGLSWAVPGGPKMYMPFRHDGGGNLDPQAVLAWARDNFNVFEGEVVGANLTYDLDFLAADGITFGRAKRFLDVLLAEPLLDENKKGQYNLNAVSKHHLGIGKDEAQLIAAAKSWGIKERDVKSSLWKLPGDQVGPYGEADSELPLRIIEKQLPLLEAEGLNQVFEVESDLIPLMLAMRQRGVRIDLARAEEVRTSLEGERDRLLAAARHEAGSSSLEFMASDSFADILIERGLDVPVKNGRHSITKEWLALNAGSDPLVAMIADGRQANTLVNTFITPMFDLQVNGRIHCEFQQLKGDEGGTIARFSSSNPNLQNQPKRNERFGAVIRSIFVPEEGEDWLRLDLSQIEYRLLAHYAVGPKAEEARQSYINDPTTDFHKMCAAAAGLDPNDKSIRTKVKGVNFGKVYGAGVAKLAKQIGCSIEEAQNFVNWYDRELPFVSATFKHAMNLAQTRGFVKTILGRRSRFVRWESRSGRSEALARADAEQRYGKENIKRAFCYAALNRVMQGGCADMMKKAMRDAYRDGIYGALGMPLVTVHDELGASKPRSPAGDEAAVALKNCMETSVKLRVPVMAEMDVAANWGEAS